MSRPVTEWKRRARSAEARVRELEALLAELAERLEKAFIRHSRPQIMEQIAIEMRAKSASSLPKEEKEESEEAAP
jgi:hypothetical protein